MLDKNSIVAASSHVYDLNKRGFKLSAKIDTPLYEMTRLSIIAEQTSNEVYPKDFTADDLATNVESRTSSTSDNTSNYDRYADPLIKDLSKLVTAHVSHAKNVIKPLVTQFADSIIKYKESNPVIEPSERFNIIKLSIPEVLKNDDFLESLSHYNDKNPISPDLKLNIDLGAIEDLNSLLLMSSGDVDKAIMTWVSGKNSTFIKDVINDFFTNKQPSNNYATNYLDIDKLNVFEKSDYALAIYLLSVYLFNNAQVSEYMNLTVYKNTVAKYRDYAGAMLVQCVKKFASYKATGLLVIELNPISYWAKVNGEVYNEWLETGGSVDVILGLIVSGEQLHSKASIDIKSSSFKNQWESYISFFKINESNKSFTYFKDFLLNTFSSMLKTLDKSELAYIEKNTNHISTVMKLALGELSKLKSNSINDPYSVALLLIAKCRFHYTNSYNILNDINEASKINGNIDVREAALFAVINYLSTYLTEQLNIEPL